MKHTKREWMPLYSFLDRKRVTAHLADMAARGWMLMWHSSTAAAFARM